MGTLWEFSGWWCVIPFLFFALLAIGCLFFAGRPGGCHCGSNRRHEEHPGG